MQSIASLVQENSGHGSGRGSGRGNHTLTEKDTEDGAMTYARILNWHSNSDGSERSEMQVIRKNVRGCSTIDTYRTGGGIYSKGVWCRLSFHSTREGVTNVMISSSKNISKHTLNVLKIEAQNMSMLLRVVVAQAGVETIEKSSRRRGGGGDEKQILATHLGMSRLQLLTLLLLIVVLISVAVFRSGPNFFWREQLNTILDIQ